MWFTVVSSQHQYSPWEGSLIFIQTDLPHNSSNPKSNTEVARVAMFSVQIWGHTRAIENETMQKQDGAGREQDAPNITHSPSHSEMSRGLQPSQALSYSECTTLVSAYGIHVNNS